MKLIIYKGIIGFLRRFDYKTIVLFVCTVLWTALIFVFSSQPAEDSAQISGMIADWILKRFAYIYKGHPPEIISGVILAGDHFVRKAGHFIEYLVLGILTAMFFIRLRTKRPYVISILTCLLYAVSDEIHQMFVPGRGPMVSDVFLDTIAATVGMTSFNLVSLIKRFIPVNTRPDLITKKGTGEGENRVTVKLDRNL